MVNMDIKTSNRSLFIRQEQTLLCSSEQTTGDGIVFLGTKHKLAVVFKG
jgi:hypothetical protein